MAILLGLLAAVAYGASDFTAGLGSRRIGTGAVTAIVQLSGLIAASVALLIVPGKAPDANVLIWGALSGLGSAVGSLALYRALAVGEMSIVAPLSTIVTALLPVIVGIALGEQLSGYAIAGIVLAFPGIVLVSFSRHSASASGAPKGLVAALVSGLGFGFLFIALDFAGTQSGSWPLVPGQALAFLMVLPFGWQAWNGLRRSKRTMAVVAAAGLLSGVANLLFLAATGGGELSVVAVLTALYPAVTVMLARIVLRERWSVVQTTGLAVSAAAVVLMAWG